MERKAKVLITFRKNGENGGPYVSHKRLMESTLKYKYDFIPYYLPKTRELLNPLVLHKEIDVIRKIDPDIFHFSGLLLEGFASCCIAILSGCKRRVCAIHGSTVDNVNQNKLVKSIIQQLENWTLRHSTICYGVSDFVCTWPRVKKHGTCFGCIYNLTDDNNTSKYDLRADLGLDADSTIIISTSRIEKDKGYDILVESAEIILKEGYNNIHFVIAGSGSYLQYLVEKVKKLGIDHHFHFLGYRKDIGEILDSSNIFLLCTLHETLCMSIVEAANHSLPVISTAVGGIPEIVKNGCSGILVQPNDVNEIVNALTLLLENDELCRKMGREGKQIVDNKFKESNVVSKVDQMYSEILY